MTETAKDVTANVRAGEPLTVSVKEACRVTDLSNSTIYNLIGAGKIETRKVGTRTLVVYGSLKALLGLSDDVARG